MDNQEILFATRNRAKIAQLVFVIDYLDLPFVVISAYNRYKHLSPYPEKGSNVAQIALQGAETIAQELRMPVITEDTSFHVEALDMHPGIHAGEYLRVHGREGILEAMRGQDNRRAEISSALAWASPFGDSQVFTRVLGGDVAHEQRWTPGLPDWVAPTRDNVEGGGYNAIFYPDGKDQTLAEIRPESAMIWGYREPNFTALLNFLMERAAIPGRWC